MKTSIVWFRSDLRLTDNPALDCAVRNAGRLVPVYIHAPGEAQPWAAGAASRWWLHHGLAILRDQLARLGSRLIIRPGPSATALETLAGQCDASLVCWNRMYEPALVARDAAVTESLTRRGLGCETFNGSLLFEPSAVKTGAGGPFRVFTPFWRACQRIGFEAAPLAAPEALPAVDETLASETLEDLDLLPAIPWDSGLGATWDAGEDSAANALEGFIDGALPDYPTGRDYPSEPLTSKLSPYLRLGQIGPRQIVWALRHHTDLARDEAQSQGAEALIRQLGWREFAHHVLHHFPQTPHQPLDPRFANLPWRKRADRLLKAWQRGRTGYPMVDAGMRELWHSGWMHNRVRMIVASFLTKNCRISWQAGARWFWDTLVDADLATNTLNWQWVAGCGADAAPYFRIFNPVRQGEKFDAAGHYVRRWVPELAPVPDRWIHTPWNMPAEVQKSIGVSIGRHYPIPILDLAATRKEALANYHEHVRRGRAPSQ